MFTASEFISGKPAPLLRLFSFKENKIINGKDSRFREERGVSYERRQIFATFYMSKFIRGNMSRFKTPSNELLDKLSILEVAIEASIAKIQTQQGPNSLIVKGIDNAYNDFKKDLIKYISTTEIWPVNHSKLKTAQKQIGYDYNTMLNSVLSSVNIIPTKEVDICRN